MPFSEVLLWGIIRQNRRSILQLLQKPTTQIRCLLQPLAKRILLRKTTFHQEVESKSPKPIERQWLVIGFRQDAERNKMGHCGAVRFFVQSGNRHIGIIIQDGTPSDE